MKIGLNEFEKNENLKLKAHSLLKLPPSIKVDFALDAVHGLNDVSRGLADLHPHKRTIVTLGALPSPLKEVVTGFAKQGYVVQELPCDFLKPMSELKNILIMELNKLKKDTLFLFCSDVEPLSGVFYPLNAIREEILQKNIYILNYQSPASLQSGMKLPQSPLEVTIIDAQGGSASPLCLVLRGERCVGEALLWADPHLEEGVVEDLVKKSLSMVRYGYFEEQLVMSFEKNVSEYFKSLIKILPLHVPRLYDRALFFVKGVNGDALAKELLNQGFEASTSDSDFWKNPHINSWLPHLGFSKEDAQTMVTLSLESIQRVDALEKLKTAIEKYQKISGTQI